MKQKLRKEALEIRKKLSAYEKKELEGKIIGMLISSRDFKSAKTIMLYFPVHNEVDCAIAIEDAMKTGKIVCCPCIEGNEIVAREIGGKLQKSKFGVLEPFDGKIIAPDEIDLVIVPGVAFDRRGGRIGYGQGFYDRFLKKTSAKKIALAYGFQVGRAFANESHDVPVDKIVTEKEIIYCKT
ncbi:5-formyltetrahydrofolate cyclo-ligase [Candidatus Micrarchaeota archaeon]|nr:5-formyltetrahydrofolate cyclo-ligase [Candidatus Micrarchaeota archaeon]